MKIEFLEVLPAQWMRVDRVVAVSASGKVATVAYDDSQCVDVRRHVFESPEAAWAWCVKLKDLLNLAIGGDHV